MIFALQVAVSVIFFAQKVFVLVGKKTGWLLGAVAAFLGIYYFSHFHRYIFTVLEVGLLILMGYAFVKSDEKNPNVEMRIRLTTIFVMVALAYGGFSGLVTLAELGGSLGLLLGTYYLTHDRARLGWELYLVGHAFSAFVGYTTMKQPFFADFQIASAVVSMVGVALAAKKKSD